MAALEWEALANGVNSEIQEISEQTTDVDGVEEVTSDFDTGLLDDALLERTWR